MKGHFCLQYVAPGAHKEVECVECSAFLFSHRMNTCFAAEVRLVTKVCTFPEPFAGYLSIHAVGWNGID